jgi:tRNA(adenine34) deaminase
MRHKPHYYMKKALDEARNAELDGEVPVGAVLVRDGKLVARGRNAMIATCDPSAHAEIRVLRRGARRLGSYRIVNTELFVTLEPCLMCYSAMVQARIARVWYGAADPKTGIFSTGAFAKVAGVYNHTIAVENGLMAAECSALLKEFFKARRGAGAVERDGLENRCTG